MTKFHGVGPVLVSRDVEAAIEWFRETLAFEPTTVMRGHGPGQEDDGDDDHEHTGPVEFAIMARDGIQFFLTAGPNVPAKRDEGFDVYFWVDGVEELYERCQANGAQIAYPIEDMFYGLREFGLESPDGHRISVGGQPKS